MRLILDIDDTVGDFIIDMANELGISPSKFCECYLIDLMAMCSAHTKTHPNAEFVPMPFMIQGVDIEESLMFLRLFTLLESQYLESMATV